RFVFHFEETERGTSPNHGIDVYAARAFLSGSKSMDIIPRGRKGTDMTIGHAFTACFADKKTLLRGVFRRLADYFKIAKLYGAFEAERANRGVWMVVRGQNGARLHTPLNDKKWFSSKAGTKPDAPVNVGVWAKFAVRYLS